MPIQHAVLLLAALPALLLLTARLRLHAFLALLAVSYAYGLAGRISFGYIGQSFGGGFADALTGVGLVVVAGSLVGTLAERSGAAARLAALAWPRRLLLPLGWLAGVGGSPAAAFALLQPLQRAVAPDRAVGLGLALLAGHALLLPAPGFVAALAILDADVWNGFAIGLAAAAAAALAGFLAVGRRQAGPAAVPSAALRGSGGAWSLLLPVLLPLALLALASLGQIPSEPLGGGGTRSMLLGLGQPALLLAVAALPLLLPAPSRDAAALSEQGWVGEALRRAATPLLLVGAAGGFGRLLQNTGSAELLAERLLGAPLGLLLPFVLAALLKAMHGSTLTACITAAGMTAPLLAPLGLDGTGGRALAAAAVGAGAMAACHVNDPLFWLVTDGARLSPARGLLLLSGGGLLQGAAAVLLLLLLGGVLT